MNERAEKWIFDQLDKTFEFEGPYSVRELMRASVQWAYEDAALQCRSAQGPMGEAWAKAIEGAK